MVAISGTVIGSAHECLLVSIRAYSCSYTVENLILISGARGVT